MQMALSVCLFVCQTKLYNYSMFFFRFESPFSFNEVISPVCLPDINQQIDRSSDLYCYTAGWGGKQTLIFLYHFHKLRPYDTYNAKKLKNGPLQSFPQ